MAFPLIAWLVVGGVAVAALSAPAPKKRPRGELAGGADEPRLTALEQVPAASRPAVASALDTAGRGLRVVADDLGERARSIPASQLAAIARRSIDWGPSVLWDDYGAEVVDLETGPDTPERRVRALQIAMLGVAYGVGIRHDPGRADPNVTRQDVEEAAFVAVGVVQWWTSPATYWRPDQPRAWSADVLRYAARMIEFPHCDIRTGHSPNNGEGYTMDEIYELMGGGGCAARSAKYKSWLAAAILEWVERRGLERPPSGSPSSWPERFSPLGTEADQLDLIATLAPVLVKVAAAKVTVWREEPPSPYDDWGAGDYVAAIIGAVVAAAVVAAASAGVGVAVGGAVAGAAAAVAGAVSTAATAIGSGISAVTAAVTGAITAAGVALGLTPAAAAALAAIIVGAAATAIGDAISEAAE